MRTVPGAGVMGSEELLLGSPGEREQRVGREGRDGLQVGVRVDCRWSHIPQTGLLVACGVLASPWLRPGFAWQCLHILHWLCLCDWEYKFLVDKYKKLNKSRYIVGVNILTLCQNFDTLMVDK